MRNATAICMELLRKYKVEPSGRTASGCSIFLEPSEIDASDEYRDADPYTVRQSLQGEFHQRRIRCTSALVALAQSKLAPALRILDLGCGEGHITQAILEASPGAELSGLDYSVSAIDYASLHFPDIDFAVGNAYQTPYASGYFDLVVCNNLWEHVPDPLTLLKEVSRVSRAGGGVIISTPSRYRLENLMKVLKGRSITLMSKHHVTEYSVGQVMEQLSYGGYELLKCYSEPIAVPWSWWDGRLFASLISALIRWTGSHHQLESTVFYLAAKKPPHITSVPVTGLDFT